MELVQDRRPRWVWCYNCSWTWSAIFLALVTLYQSLIVSCREGVNQWRLDSLVLCFIVHPWPLKPQTTFTQLSTLTLSSSWWLSLYVLFLGYRRYHQVTSVHLSYCLFVGCRPKWNHRLQWGIFTPKLHPGKPDHNNLLSSPVSGSTSRIGKTSLGILTEIVRGVLTGTSCETPSLSSG